MNIKFARVCLSVGLAALIGLFFFLAGSQAQAAPAAPSVPTEMVAEFQAHCDQRPFSQMCLKLTATVTSTTVITHGVFTPWANDNCETAVITTTCTFTGTIYLEWDVICGPLQVDSTSEIANIEDLSHCHRGWGAYVIPVRDDHLCDDMVDTTYCLFMLLDSYTSTYTITVGAGAFTVSSGCNNMENLVVCPDRRGPVAIGFNSDPSCFVATATKTGWYLEEKPIEINGLGEGCEIYLPVIYAGVGSQALVQAQAPVQAQWTNQGCALSAAEVCLQLNAMEAAVTATVAIETDGTTLFETSTAQCAPIDFSNDWVCFFDPGDYVSFGWFGHSCVTAAVAVSGLPVDPTGEAPQQCGGPAPSHYAFFPVIIRR